jgi:hypothetical protein
MMVTVHVDPCCYGNPVEAPGHEGSGTVTAVICQSAGPHLGASQSARATSAHHASHKGKSKLKRLLQALRK